MNEPPHGLTSIMSLLAIYLPLGGPRAGWGVLHLKRSRIYLSQHKGGTLIARGGYNIRKKHSKQVLWRPYLIVYLSSQLRLMRTFSTAGHADARRHVMAWWDITTCDQMQCRSHFHRTRSLFHQMHSLHHPRTPRTCAHAPWPANLTCNNRTIW
jgi:hypothetical protein